MWNLINNNFICSEKDILRNHKIYLENLLHKKSYINNKGPETPYFLKNKISLKGLIKDNDTKINNDNHILHKKLMLTLSSPSLYSKCNNLPKYCPAFDKQRFNFDKIERDINIYNDNTKFYKRFSSKQSIYSSKKFFKKNEYEKYLKKNISYSKFLPNIPLRLCTFKQYKLNLINEMKKIKGNKKNRNEFKKSNNRNKFLFKSNSSDNIYMNKNKNKINLIEYIKNNNFLNKSNNNLSTNNLYLFNSNISRNKKRSQSAITSS